jgi:catechol 2,3-dioxygenase-like lactoylglutathione lyase family enzyme
MPASSIRTSRIRMPATAMNHFTILTSDVRATVDFYRDLLGLAEGPRPPLDFPGAWLYAGGAPILHVVGGRSAEELRSGVIDHMAFSAHDLSDTLALLASRNIVHTCRRQAQSGVWQVFFFDPNGARVELDFAPGEPQHAKGVAAQ